MLLLLTLVAGLAVDPPAPPFSLADALALARRTSPLREAAVRLATSAEEVARTSGRLLNPQLDMRVENFGPGTSGLAKDVFAVVNQAIELGAKRRLRRDLANADLDAAGAQVGLTDWQLAERTTRIYVEALRARLLLESLTATHRDLAEVAGVLTRRVEEGVTPEADLLKVRADSARLDLEMVHARLALDRRLSELGYVTGLSAPPEAGRLAEPAAPAVAAVEATALAGSVARHPDARLAEARVARARQALALEHGRRRPDPLLTAGYKRTSGVDTAVAGVAFTLPFFDRNGAPIARADGEVRAAEAEQAAVMGRLMADAQSTRRAARALADRAGTVARDLVEPAEAVRSATAAALREGVVDVLRLLDAERVLREARQLAIEVRLDALAAALEARFAAGEEVLP